MLHIAVCEDDIKDRETMLALIDAYGKTHRNLAFDVKEYSNALQLAKDIEGGGGCDVYILDILMPHKNGIDLGRLIRKHQRNAVIIYSTSSKDYALDAFGLLAQRYILKPVDRKSLFEALDYGFEHAEASQDKLFLMKTNSGLVSIPFSNVVFVECASRIICLTCSDGEKYESRFIRQNFETEISPLLEDPSFIQTHKSFAINMDHIDQYFGDRFAMDNGTEIPIARKRQTDVKRHYLRFLAEYGR